MAVRVRESVFTVNPQVLVWYARAIAKLDAQPLATAGSWQFMAACHGISQSGHAGLWNECQHASWFFLPWHRGYLAGFEALISKAVKDLGGPGDWALPYWNYNARDLANPTRPRQLPPAFRNRTMPDGSRNFLWAPRNQPAPGQPLTLTPADISLAALQNPAFASVGNIQGFGGRKNLPIHFGPFQDSGAFEVTPHNTVHGAVGGLMSNPLTAALDPIFWLHHCNIDRLWESWRSQHPTGDPTDPAFQNQSFRLVGAGGTVFPYQCKQGFNTQSLLHGYQYDNIAPAGGALTVMASAGPLVATDATEAAEEAVMPIGEPELAAANTEALQLGADKVATELKPQGGGDMRPFSESVDARAAPSHYFLSVEDVAARGVARDYKVFVDLPDDDRTPLQVGVLATFGIAVASDPARGHGGNGMRQVFDISGAVQELGLGADSISRLRVTFEPMVTGQLEEIPADYPYANLVTRSLETLTVGRVNIYSQ